MMKKKLQENVLMKLWVLQKNITWQKLLKKEHDDDFEVSDLRYALEELGPAFIKLG